MAGEGEQIFSEDILIGVGGTTLDFLKFKYPWLESAIDATPAVLTGSRAYGHPRPDSDIDLVIYLPEAVLRALEDLADPDPKWEAKAAEQTYDIHQYERFAGRSKPLRFGRLNLICTTDRDIYNAWKLGTEELVRRSAEGPDVVTREEAKQLLAQLRQQVYNGGRATL